MAKREHADDLRGASRLVVDATREVTTIVQEMHRTIADGPAGVAQPFTLPGRIISGLVYGGVRGVAALVGAGLDQALVVLGPLLGGSAPGPEREALLAAVNGVLGDWLASTGNPLAIPMRLRRGGAPLTLERDALAAVYPRASGRIAVWIHGSSMCDLQWRRNGHDHGEALEDALGFAPVYAHYNSGRHVSTNGAELAELLEELVAAWPVPVEALVLVGHSMGGLVARSACLAAERAGHRWRDSLRALVCLGTPHHGAPLERIGNVVERVLGGEHYSAPLARLGKLRSAGVTDLRHGNVLDEHWAGVDRFASGVDSRCAAPLPAGVACLAIAGTTAPTLDGRLPGDGLVPVDSALGRHARADMCLAFAPEDQRIVARTNHMQLLESPHVYALIRDWLGERV
ncbi:MAG: alpha/beta hydrolase [Deltaproteobacteria bacterium]|nr:alpha/beta hydrolase [Kofleriaceae bacterium]